MYIFKPFAVLSICLVIVTSSSQAQFITSYTSPEVIATALMPASCQISDINYNGGTNSFGYFYGGYMGINQGIVLTTGYITPSQNPNGSDLGIPPLPSPISGWLANANISPLYDAAVLSFAFTSSDNNINFKYVFGSLEYHEFVGTQYRDAFAILISNADSSNIENLVKIPGTNMPVSINTVNNGYRDGCPAYGVNATNPAYFVDHCASGYYNEYDGFTKILTATKTIATNQVYRIWFIIGDGGDGLFDSGVFIKGNHPNSDIGENSASFNNLYPNPSSGTFTLTNLTEETDVTVTNSTGQTVWQQTITQTGNAEIILDEFPAGVYFLTKRSKTLTNTTKIILQK